jgi:two-component system sensor histidine kinase HydH
VNEVRRLELIVNALLQQGRASALQLAPADINRIVDDIAHLFRPHLAHQGIVLQTLLTPDLPPAPLDTDRFKQIIVNLLVNARDALGHGGTIRIETALASGGGAVVLGVADSGPGIPREQRSTLFTTPPASSKPQGLGLGMRLVAELVQGHGGSLSVDEADIGGALFEISLPVEPV